MITLEQVQKLDAKIKQAVSLISTLREENAQLRSTLSTYETKITDLESMVLSLEDDQTKIESSLIDAISKLDNLDIVEQNEVEESFGELTPSEETAIVNEEIIVENDHSEQVENTTEDSSSEIISNDENVDLTLEDSVETEENISEESEETTTDLEETNSVELEDNSEVVEKNDENIVVEDTNIVSDDVETVEDEVTEDNLTAETNNQEDFEPQTEEKVEQEGSEETKKNSDYSIPMLEIF